MAQRDASRVQLDFPQLVADVIAQLNLTGTVGLLEFSDQVTPVYIVAQRSGALAIETTNPAFGSADVAFGQARDPVANTIVADTGQLAAGTYDLMATMAFVGNITVLTRQFILEHRNAANDTTLARLLNLPVSGTNFIGNAFLPLTGYVVSLNERLRVISPAENASGMYVASVFARLRTTP